MFLKPCRTFKTLRLAMTWSECWSHDQCNGPNGSHDFWIRGVKIENWTWLTYKKLRFLSTLWVVSKGWPLWVRIGEICQVKLQSYVWDSWSGHACPISESILCCTACLSIFGCPSTTTVDHNNFWVVVLKKTASPEECERIYKVMRSGVWNSYRYWKPLWK